MLRHYAKKNLYIEEATIDNQTCKCKAKNFKNDNYYFRNKPGYLDEKSNITCGDVLGENYPFCENYKLCVEDQCRCAWGYEEPACTKSVLLKKHNMFYALYKKKKTELNTNIENVPLTKITVEDKENQVTETNILEESLILKKTNTSIGRNDFENTVIDKIKCEQIKEEFSGHYILAHLIVMEYLMDERFPFEINAEENIQIVTKNQRHKLEQQLKYVEKLHEFDKIVQSCLQVKNYSDCPTFGWYF
ncbi:hypothetical protein TcasGA2_TC016252 [Tribolium castaneum]|uniref:Uncharacterized protein n=1 Tax=Tribolium castaneum TaxID=7070 RepID=D7EJC5_TRICA|nr:hypothetical protein TcasGA2_TC016252 [Tribolium castaneum]